MRNAMLASSYCQTASSQEDESQDPGAALLSPPAPASAPLPVFAPAAAFVSPALLPAPLPAAPPAPSGVEASESEVEPATPAEVLECPDEQLITKTTTKPAASAQIALFDPPVFRNPISSTRFAKRVRRAPLVQSARQRALQDRARERSPLARPAQP
jgi:hypothetical protein